MSHHSRHQKNSPLLHLLTQYFNYSNQHRNSCRSLGISFLYDTNTNDNRNGTNRRKWNGYNSERETNCCAMENNYWFPRMHRRREMNISLEKVPGGMIRGISENNYNMVFSSVLGCFGVARYSTHSLPSTSSRTTETNQQHDITGDSRIKAMIAAFLIDIDSLHPTNRQFSELCHKIDAFWQHQEHRDNGIKMSQQQNKKMRETALRNRVNEALKQVRGEFRKEITEGLNQGRNSQQQMNQESPSDNSTTNQSPSSTTWTISQQQKELIQNFIRNHQENHQQDEITSRTNSLQYMVAQLHKQVPHVPRFVLRELIKKWKRFPVRDEHRRIIRTHLNGNLDTTTHQHSTNIPQICDQLQESINDLSRQQIYELVLRELHRMQHTHITPAQKRLIENFVSSRHDDSTLDQLMEQFTQEHPTIRKIAPPQLRTLLISAIHKNDRKRVSAKHHTIVKNLLQSINDEALVDMSPGSIVKLCDQLEEDQLSDLPRKQIHEVLTSELAKLHRSKIQSEHRIFVKEFLRQFQQNQNASVEDTSQIVSALEKEPLFNNIPRLMIHELLRKQMDNSQKKNITQEDRNIVEAHVESTLEEGSRISTAQLCDTLSDKVNLPRQQLYQLVRRTIRRFNRVEISQQDRERIEEFVQQCENSRLVSNLPTLVNQFLQNITANDSISQIPLWQLRQEFSFAAQRKLRASISVEQRQYIRQFVSQRLEEKQHIGEEGVVRHLCDEFCSAADKTAASISAEIGRVVLYEVVNSEVIKRRHRSL